MTGLPTRRDAVSEIVRRRLEQLLGDGLTSDSAPEWSASQQTDQRTPDALPSRAEAPDEYAAETASPVPARMDATKLVGRGLAFGRQHLIVVLIIALAGCLWAAVSMSSARTVPVAAVSVTPTAVTPSPTATPTPVVVVVHVLGGVVSPGVVRLHEGARVEDAIAAAGGMRPDAAPGQLNLAALVVDGSQIVIGTTASPGGEVRGAPSAGPSGTGGGASGTGGLVNLNTATASDLDGLPGVGPVTASAILAWRDKHGKFTRVEELQEVDGIGPKTYAQLAPKVRV